MNIIEIYILIVAIYGILDIVLQKNSKTIVSSKSKDKTYLPIIVTFMLNLAFAPIEFIELHRQVHPITLWVGIVFCIAATYFRLKGQLDLGHGFSTRIEKQDNHQLVTKGLYAQIRHPLYLALILLLIGANLMLSVHYAWVFLVINAYTLKIRIDKEEEFLKENLEGYPDYMKRTKRLVPFVW